LLKARHYKGFGIHSPFVFNLVRELIYETHPFYAFTRIDAARRMLKRTNHQVGLQTFGAVSVKNKASGKVKHLVSRNSIPLKYGRLMFRLINYFKAREIVEIGTGIGLGTLFLALPDSGGRITTIDGNPELCSLAGGLFEVVGVENARVVNGQFREELPGVLSNLEKLDFVFFDGDHRMGPTLQYFEMCLAKIHNDTIFVFDDIHWSREMEQAWGTIVEHPLVRVSIDLYRVGIVFFRKECTKQHYVVWF